MICSICEQEEVHEFGQVYQAGKGIFGVDNVILKNAELYKCKCGFSLILPLRASPLYLAIVFQLVTKTDLLSKEEFDFVWKCLFICAAEDNRFAESIGFYDRDLFKFNDFSKLDRSSDDAMIESMQKHFNTGDDVIVNKILGDEVRDCLAKKLGLKNGLALVNLTGVISAKTVPPELDFSVRQAVELTKHIPRYPAYSEFDFSGSQMIYVEMSENENDACLLSPEP